ncbi:UPF0184 protein [Strongylocentrotus purpuratus]|uniref:Uncharacterized protein n=1 Tax=Strongylocentrotus purpuratus TaxID=7668 RepID=A0A7M7RHK3_STRPU|nr:UPF0184 protein [Strongylocentrotus purpuratus]
MANGEMNHPEPLERHVGNEEEEEENQENNVAVVGGDSEEENDMSTSEQDELLEEISEQDYSALDRTLDQIDSCLDQLDQKNDDLNVKLRALLAASRQEYEELTAARTAGDAAGSTEGH